MFYPFSIYYICLSKIIGIMKLVFASTNKNKIKEIQLLLPTEIQNTAMYQCGKYQLR
jgi:hypothetical protein